MALPLARSIGDDSALLHENTTEAYTGSITINVETLVHIWLRKDRRSGEKIFQSLEGLFKP